MDQAGPAARGLLFKDKHLLRRCIISTETHQSTQEARRVVGAEIQHITYKEFLPALLGERLIDTFHLRPKANGYHMGYNDDLPVSTINSVANAILPLVMSLMPGSLLYVKVANAKEGGIRRQVPLNATFWAPFDAHDPLLVQEIILGLALSPAQNLDLNVAAGAKRCESGMKRED